MELFIAIVLFIVGIALVVKGGDFFVEASCWISDVTGIPRVIIGATLVSFATTAPEFFVSLIAAIRGANDLAVGNAVGSVIGNLGIGFALLTVCMPGKVGDKLFGVKGLLMIGAMLLLLALSWGGTFSIAEGIGLLALYGIFVFVNIRFSRDADADGPRHKPDKKEAAIQIGKFVFGAAGIVFGADLIVTHGQTLARYIGLSDAVVGLTLIAIGTSLPELVTAITAIVKKEHSLSLGNIIGANILDITMILSATAIVSGKKGLPVSPETVYADMPVTLLLMLLAVLPSTLGKRTYRWQGILLFVVYGAYLTYLFVWR